MKESLLVLDTKHLRCLVQHEAATLPLLRRLNNFDGAVATTLISAEEQLPDEGCSLG